MPSAKHSFRLVVYAHQLDPHIFREILADKLNLNRADAMRLVAHAPGILPMSMSRRRAGRLGRLLASVGVQVGVWPEDRLPDLRDPCVVHKVACRPLGLETFGPRGEPLHWVPWAQLELINIGEFPGGVRELSLSGPTWMSASVGTMRALVLGYRRSGLHVRKLVDQSQLELWLVRCRPTQVIRIPQDQVSYEYLQERRQSSARANFRVLIEDLKQFAPHATITPSARSFLHYERPAIHHFASAHHFQQDTEWQLLVRWRDRAESSE